MSIEKSTEFSERIKAIREAAKLTREAFGVSLEVSGAYIGQLEKGVKTNPSALFLNSVEKQYKVSRKWLESGIGEMRPVKPYSSAEEHEAFGEKNDPDPITAKINIMLADMTDQQRRDILKYVEEKKQLADLIAEKQQRKAG